MPKNNAAIHEETVVRERYAQAARRKDDGLCCPVRYDPALLEIIPREILERDYGCGDPTPYVRPGDTVLDLGSGAGKVCYIAAQIVGRQGRVIGVDCSPEMLALARRHRDAVAERLGYANVEFRYGMIQDLALDLDLLAIELHHRPVRNQQDWLALRALEASLRRHEPMIPTESVDCVISNCVLNLVQPGDRPQLFREIFRVLKKGGRAAICDIVADEDVPERLMRDPQLWSGCLAGAFREDEFPRQFEQAGFHGIHIASRQAAPWRTVDGIEFRALTVVAFKGKQGPCLERRQALIYRGPFQHVADDDGQVFFRGERTAVCDRTFHLLQQEPYEGMFDPVEPKQQIPLEAAAPFDRRRSTRRAPSETKGSGDRITTLGQDGCCARSGSCS